MDVVADKELVVEDLAGFEAGLADSPRADLLAEDLAAHIVLAHQHKLHLVKDKVHLLFVLKASVGLNLDFLDLLRSFLYFAISLVHFNQLLS